MGEQECEALLYYPAKSPATKAVILVHGISELGCYHPTLINLSRSLADKGFLVIAPDIQAFRQFRITAEPIDQILFWYSQTAGLQEARKVKKTGLAGISFSGTLALIAAARPEVRDGVSFVIAVGPYCNLIRCTRSWLAAGPVTVSEGYYPTRFYAKWVTMLAALDIIAADRDRLFLHSVLEGLLLEKKIPPADSELTVEGQRWYRFATMREDQSDPELAKKIEEHLVSGPYRQLEPNEALDKIRCPVFLVHGTYDDLMPPEESLELHRRLGHSYLLLSPLLTHTHPYDRALSAKQKAGAVFDILVFLYQLSRITGA